MNTVHRREYIVATRRHTSLQGRVTIAPTLMGRHSVMEMLEAVPCNRCSARTPPPALSTIDRGSSPLRLILRCCPHDTSFGASAEENWREATSSPPHQRDVHGPQRINRQQLTLMPGEREFTWMSEDSGGMPLTVGERSEEQEPRTYSVPHIMFHRTGSSIVPFLTISVFHYSSKVPFHGPGKWNFLPALRCSGRQQ